MMRGGDTLPLVGRAIATLSGTFGTSRCRMRCCGCCVHWRVAPLPRWRGVTALRSSPSSSVESGRAATLRAEKKVAKYERIMLSVGGVFRAGVVERFGAVGDSLAGLVRQTVGDAARQGDEDDYSFTAQRMLSWAMQHVVFGAVMGDAAMLEAALERDVYGLSADGAAAAPGRVRDAGGAARRGAFRPRRGRVG